jgi:hypothetical protein
MMNTKKTYLLIPVVAAFCIMSCSRFEEYNTNPNGSSTVTAGMLATKLMLPLLSNTSTTHGQDKYMVNVEEIASNLDNRYNALGRGGLGNIASLRNIEKMIAFAPEGGYRNSYTALGHFIRACYFYDHTMRMGDIPYSDAIKGEEGIYYPAYDAQEDIFAGILNELDAADSLFAVGTQFPGDPYSYGGDPAKWRKLVNAFELRVLINLAGKTGVARLRVAERFRKIVAERPLFTSNGDNYLMVWSDTHRFQYASIEDRNGEQRYMTTMIIDTLKRYNDRRLFYYARPTKAAVAAGIPANNPNAYAGLDSSEPQGVVANPAEVISRINERYTDGVAGEPTYIVASYVEQNFTIAEAAVRGLIAADAKTYYDEAIRASMKWTADNTADEVRYHHNMKIDDAYINSYLASSGVLLSSNTGEAIHQIIVQKYLASFLRASDLPWFDQRRTGYPAFPINPATNRNQPSDKMPVRWMYPEAEFNYNTENVQAAVARQFGGTDDNNGIMWILK